MERSKKGLQYAALFVQKIIENRILKEHLPNHFISFSKGLEENERIRFNNYIYSCDYFLTSNMLLKDGGYHG